MCLLPIFLPQLLSLLLILLLHISSNLSKLTFCPRLKSVLICCFSDLSSEINRFEISLSNKTKKSKESDICKYMYKLNNKYSLPNRSLFFYLLSVVHTLCFPPHLHLSLSVFMRCQLNRLQKGQMIDEWFPLSSHVPLKGIEPGSLRVRARYSMEKIMPEEEYFEFKEV